MFDKTHNKAGDRDIYACTTILDLEVQAVIISLNGPFLLCS